MTADNRIPILYLAPWVDYGGTDKGTIDWFRWLDRDRYAPSLATTQPSANRRLTEVLPYADEVWPLPELMSGGEMPLAVLDLVHTRGVRVVHIMNSRLGYDLLPDLSCVPRPPKVVVQLHVEEQDRSGYVRYVTTRYGNLVDAFSVTSEHLADAVRGYGIPRDKIRVIYTGVDAEAEFAPARTQPVTGLAGDRVHILYPGRLVAQKDPLLMVDVAAGLRDRGLRFQIHAVGEGPLEQDVRSRAAELGLGDHVVVHPPTAQLQPWYAGCDVLLMTSVFEGVPYVVYEAMAMELPIVAPALPGNAELLGDAAAGLIEPRDDVDRYVAALEPLVRDQRVREDLGRRGRARVCERFSLQRMAGEHVRLYDDLIGRDTARVADPVAGNGGLLAGEERQTPLRFRDRRLFETPLVSVIVPCFNQGRVLSECLNSVRAQTHPAVEVIVVDDGSTDSETIEVMDGLQADHELTVIRLAENGGPSRARNVALERCSGRYVLPVDSDNVLLPDAIERLVDQIKTAGEEVGFIYPNLRYFGNREDHFEAPPWDLYALLQGNLCDVCSLFDRAVFDAGERFDESIRLGHEDWEFVLRLGARGVRGEPAHADTVRYRKWGFNRSDAVEYAPTVFGKLVRELSPLSRHEHELKACWSPALSMVALTPVDPRSEAGERLAHRLAAQTCIDMELIARFEGEWARPGSAPPVRRVHPELARSPGAALAHARELARGNFIAVTTGTGSALLADRAFAEKLLRLFESVGERGRPPFDALVLADTGDDGRVPLSLIDQGWGEAAPPHTVIWPVEVEERVPDGVTVDGERPVESLAKACAAMMLRTQWRHLSADPGRRTCGEAAPVRLTRSGGLSETERRVKEERRARDPIVPKLPPDTVPRLVYAPTWVPPQSSNLCRHREIGGERRIVTLDRRPPRGYEIEFDLGCVRAFSLEGTARLVATAEGGYAVLPRGDWDAAPPGARHLGYVELAAFPLLEPLLRARHVPTGQQVLVSGEWDAMMREVEPIETLGFIEAFPVNPRFASHVEAGFGLKGLTKSVDLEARRHHYAVGAPAQGELVGELGALFDVPQTPAVRAWLVDGRLVTEAHRFRHSRPGPLVAARWTLAPLRWRGFSEPLPKARAAMRRSLDAVGEVTSRRAEEAAGADGQPAGWLLREPLDGTLPLYAAYHPVNGDQLLSRDPYEPVAMGYGEPALLGHLRARAPVTGSLQQRLVGVPWASRFGLRGLTT